MFTLYVKYTNLKSEVLTFSSREELGEGYKAAISNPRITLFEVL